MSKQQQQQQQRKWILNLPPMTEQTARLVANVILAIDPKLEYISIEDMGNPEIQLKCRFVETERY